MCHDRLRLGSQRQLHQRGGPTQSRSPHPTSIDEESSSSQWWQEQGHVCHTLTFPKTSAKANEADTFKDFTSSLMSVGTTSDDGTISVFTKDGVTVHKEEDVLITCKGEPILIGVRDRNGQQRGHWQPRRPTKRQRKFLRQANSVYDLPSTEQAIKWMHAVCGYPVKSTWLKAVKAGNYVGWPMLTEHNVKKYSTTPKPSRRQRGT